MKTYIILASWLALASCTSEHREAIEIGWEAYSIIVPVEKEMDK